MTAQTTPTPPENLQGENQGHVPWLLRRIWERLNVKNEHFMGVIVGQEGSGKSYTAIRIANEVDPSFHSGRIIFDVADLLKRLKNGEHQRGNFYVLDEAGVQLGRRTWQDRSQILANQALQLIRDHNLGLIFTLPRLGEFDSQAQGRLQAAFEITKKEDGEYVRGKWKFFDPDRMDETGQIYKKFPRRRQNGQLKRITSLAFAPPSDDIIAPYEETKSEFQDEFYEEVISEIEGGTDEDENDGELDDPREIAKDILKEDRLDDFKGNNHGQVYIDRDLIELEYDIGRSKSKKVKKVLQQKEEI